MVEAVAEEEVEIDLSTTEAQVEALSGYGMAELRLVAERIGAQTARDKDSLIGNIVARANEQGLSFSGYAGNLDDPGVGTASAEEEQAEEGLEAPELVAEAVAEPAPEAVEEQEAPVFDPYQTNVKHFFFTISDIDEPDMNTFVYDVKTVNKEVSRYLKAGYVPVEVYPAGNDVSGHRLGWVLVKEDGEPQYSEAKHIIRTMTAQADPAIGTVTGFQADAYLSSYLDDGWELVGAKFNGQAAEGGGIYMIWFLIR